VENACSIGNLSLNLLLYMLAEAKRLRSQTSFAKIRSTLSTCNHFTGKLLIDVLLTEEIMFELLLESD